jgi:lipoyl-dependent peroxiredoxin
VATRRATAKWQGTLNEGSGTLAVGSGALDAPYSFQSRFEDGAGTNPDELIGAAHAGCFTMALSGILGEAGHDPESLETNASVHLRMEDVGPTIARIDLEVHGLVPGIDQARFEEHARAAKEGCAVSRALAGVREINLNAQLDA